MSPQLLSVFGYGVIAAALVVVVKLSKPSKVSVVAGNTYSPQFWPVPPA